MALCLLSGELVMLRQYNVVFYCATLAESEEEAVLIAMEQVKTDQAAYVEVEELDIINEETEE
jgi:hypothetical protein